MMLISSEKFALWATAWKKGVKSLYYCRSMSIQRAEAVMAAPAPAAELSPAASEPRLPLATAAERPSAVNYEECLSCQ